VHALPPLQPDAPRSAALVDEEFAPVAQGTAPHYTTPTFNQGRPMNRRLPALILGATFGVTLGVTAGCSPPSDGASLADTPSDTPSHTPAGTALPSDHLFAWTAAADTTQPDFLAVLDVRPGAPGDRYGGLVTTLPVPGVRNDPHHTEHEMPADGRLFANGYVTGQTWVFDLTTPETPRLAAQFGDLDGYAHPHSYVRLPNGNVLASFHMRHDAEGMTPGGLVEITPRGEAVRSSSAFGAGLPREARTYSLAVVPALDRVVSTTTDMDERNPHLAREVQVWRLSDLALLHTFELPPGPRGDEADYTAEPRVLSDGRTVIVTTFSCGIYLLEGLEGEAPGGRFVASLPRSEDTWCAIPVVSGDHLVITVEEIPGVVSLDLADPVQPREVGRVTLPEGWVPHWLALEPNGRRLVLTGHGAMANRVILLSHDPATGALALDERFRDEGAAEPGVRLAGVPHGAVFSR